MMKRLIDHSAIFFLILLIPFIYFFIRDVYRVEGSSGGGECIPYDLEVVPARLSVMVKWKTEQDCTGYIRYSLTTQDENGTVANGEGGFIPSQEHTVLIKELKPETTYYVSIISNEERYGEKGNPIRVQVK